MMNKEERDSVAAIMTQHIPTAIWHIRRTRDALKACIVAGKFTGRGAFTPETADRVRAFLDAQHDVHMRLVNEIAALGAWLSETGEVERLKS